MAVHRLNVRASYLTAVLQHGAFAISGPRSNVRPGDVMLLQPVPNESHEPRFIEWAMIVERLAADPKGVLTHRYWPDLAIRNPWLIRASELVPTAPFRLTRPEFELSYSSQANPAQLSAADGDKALGLLRPWDARQFASSMSLDSPEWTLMPGETVRRRELHAEVGGSPQAGISPSSRSRNILVFSDAATGSAYGYSDHWEGGVFHYTGEGQVGDQEMSRGNRALLNHEQDGRAVRLFNGSGGEVQYVGEFRVEGWYQVGAPDRLREFRKVIVFRLRPIDEVTEHDGTRLSKKPVGQLGLPYTPVPETTVVHQRPFDVDPEQIDRGTEAHRRIQNRLAEQLEQQGISPLSPRPDGPDFDLAWRRRGVWYVVEVKSLRDENESRQLRLGLGQVLDYQDLLLRRHARVRAVLAVERQPRDPRWFSLCQRAGVALVWPGTFDTVIERGLRSRA